MIPFGEGMFLANLNVGVLFVIAITSINAIAIFISGWASNNKFALLGSMRAVLTRELGAMYYRPADWPGAGPTRLMGEA